MGCGQGPEEGGEQNSVVGDVQLCDAKDVGEDPASPRGGGAGRRQPEAEANGNFPFPKEGCWVAAGLPSPDRPLGPGQGSGTWWPG